MRQYNHRAHDKRTPITPSLALLTSPFVSIPQEQIAQKSTSRAQEDQSSPEPQLPALDSSRIGTFRKGDFKPTHIDVPSAGPAARMPDQSRGRRYGSYSSTSSDLSSILHCDSTAHRSSAFSLTFPSPAGFSDWELEPARGGKRASFSGGSDCKDSPEGATTDKKARYAGPSNKREHPQLRWLTERSRSQLGPQAQNREHTINQSNVFTSDQHPYGFEYSFHVPTPGTITFRFHSPSSGQFQLLPAGQAETAHREMYPLLQFLADGSLQSHAPSSWAGGSIGHLEEAIAEENQPKEVEKKKVHRGGRRNTARKHRRKEREKRGEYEGKPEAGPSGSGPN